MVESRACLERQRRKLLATKCIVRAAQQCQLRGDRLAALAYKCTRWASILAQEEATRDFQRAYPAATTPTAVAVAKDDCHDDDTLLKKNTTTTITTNVTTVAGGASFVGWKKRSHSQEEDGFW